jgi:hypothetical protein
VEINNNNYEYLRNQVGPALQSKLEEFQILGYRDISEPQLWEYLLKKKWKKVTEEMKLHQAIQDIFSVKVSDYMNFATVELYKAAEALNTNGSSGVVEVKDDGLYILMRLELQPDDIVMGLNRTLRYSAAASLFEKSLDKELEIKYAAAYDKINPEFMFR